MGAADRCEPSRGDDGVWTSPDLVQPVDDLGPKHDLAAFDCGSDAQTTWLDRSEHRARVAAAADLIADVHAEAIARLGR